MSYNYHNTQDQKYSTGQTNTGIPQSHQQYGQYNQYQTQHQTQPQTQSQNQQNQMSSGFNDPFFNFGNDAFKMDIKEDFDDPFSGMGNRIGGFGFPDIASIEHQMLGQFQNEMQQMQQLGDGNQQSTYNNQQLTTGDQGEGKRGLFFNIQSNGSSPGTMISKTYVSKVDLSGGQPKEESYQSQAIKQFGEGGHSISERQEAYKNSMTGIQKAAHQRLLDDRGTKLIKQRNVNTGEQSEHNILKGLTENDVSGFNKQYNDYREKVHFQDNYKYLDAMNPGKIMKQLGSGKGQQNTNTNLYLGDGNYNGQNHHNFGNTNSYQQGNQYNYTSNQYQNSNIPQSQQQNHQYNQYQTNSKNYHSGY
jgi:hypothetical protein